VYLLFGCGWGEDGDFASLGDEGVRFKCLIVTGAVAVTATVIATTTVVVGEEVVGSVRVCVASSSSGTAVEFAKPVE